MDDCSLPGYNLSPFTPFYYFFPETDLLYHQTFVLSLDLVHLLNASGYYVACADLVPLS